MKESELSEEESDKEGMEEEGGHGQVRSCDVMYYPTMTSHSHIMQEEGGMTVLLCKKPEKKSLPAITRREAKEMRKINPQPGKQRQKALKRKERLIRQLGK